MKYLLPTEAEALIACEFMEIDRAVLAGELEPGLGPGQAGEKANLIISRFGEVCYGFEGAQYTGHFASKLLELGLDDLDTMLIIDWVKGECFSNYWNAYSNVVAWRDWTSQGRKFDAAVAQLRSQVSLSRIVALAEENYPVREKAAEARDILCK